MMIIFMIYACIAIIVGIIATIRIQCCYHSIDLDAEPDDAYRKHFPDEVKNANQVDNEANSGAVNTVQWWTKKNCK